MKTGLYHHGDAGLISAINKLAKPFQNSESLLKGDGFFGSSVNPKPSSARYTSVKIMPHIKKIVSENHALNVKNPEGGYDWLHTEFPIGLMTHIVGIAVGYSSNILPRKMSDIQEYLDGKAKQLKPYFVNFAGKIKTHNGVKKGWLFEGVFEADDSAMTMKIGDLPPLSRYDSFVKKMYLKLEEFGEQCKIENNSQGNVNILIKWRDRATWPSVKEGISKLTKLIVVEGLVFVKDGSLVEYEEISDYLDEFRIHRERVIYKKMVYNLLVNNGELEFLRAKVLFMKFMMEKKRKHDEVKTWLSAYNQKIRTRLDNIKLTSLTAEHLKQTEEDIIKMEVEIKRMKIENEKQLKTCLSMEKTFKGKGVISLAKNTDLLEDAGINIHFDGVELYSTTEDNEEEISEEEPSVEDVT
jgi:DNA gyrase/topoisomerase IV subunit A